MIAITASRLYTPRVEVRRPVVMVESGTIVEIASQEERPVPPCRRIDLGEATLAPGYVDIHVHGGAGCDVMDRDLGGLRAMEAHLARHGVSGYLATTMTAPLDRILQALERLAKAITMRGTAGEKRARPLGIHLEGPFLNRARRGVHPEAEILAPSARTFVKMWEASEGQVRLITLAPEVEGAAEVIAEAAKRNVKVSAGHSDATLEAERAAVRLGVRHATHAFNAMPPLGHRDPGMLGEVLTNAAVSADIIADGIHVDAAVVRMFLALKGADKAVLISDGIAATGMPDGRYHLGQVEVDVREGRCTAGGRLAGSVLTLDRAVQNVMRFAEWTLQDAVRLATGNAAAAAGLGMCGRLEAGVPADMVALGPDGEVRGMVLGGERCDFGAS